MQHSWYETATKHGSVGQGGITAPGSICATPVETPIDVEEGLPAEIPLVYYYGHTTPDANPDLYRSLVERMASMLDRRTEQNAKVDPLFSDSSVEAGIV